MPVRENLVPLSDGAGEVIEIGPGVTRVKVGDRVAGCFFQRWAGGEAPADVHASALGGGIDGMLLEEEGIVKIPAHLSLEEGATLRCRHGLERHDGARKTRRRPDRVVAGRIHLRAGRLYPFVQDGERARIAVDWNTERLRHAVGGEWVGPIPPVV